MILADFLGTVAGAVAALRLEASAYSPAVRLWMGFMATTFIAGVLFAPRKVEARIVLVTMLTTACLLIGTKIAWPGAARAFSGASIHLLLWSPLLAFLAIWRGWKIIGGMRAGRFFDKAFGVWVGLVASVLAVSLAFDFHTVVAWLAG